MYRVYFFFEIIELEPATCSVTNACEGRRVAARPGAHEVQWTSVLRGPKRSEEQAFSNDRSGAETAGSNPVTSIFLCFF